SSASIASDTQPTPNDSDKAQPGGKETIPWRTVLKGLEGVGIAAGVFYAIVSFWMWRAMIDANNMARKTSQVSQRAYVTVGRKDGIVANFVASEAGNATGLVIYFQNSGHLPAKLSWGPLMTAIVPPIPGFAP